MACRYKVFSIGLNAVWRAESPWFQGTTNRLLKANTKFDLTGGFRINKRVSFYVQGRNIFEEPHRIFEQGAGNPDALFRYENYGTNWSFGLKESFWSASSSGTGTDERGRSASNKRPHGHVRAFFSALPRVGAVCDAPTCALAGRKFLQK